MTEDTEIYEMEQYEHGNRSRSRKSLHKPRKDYQIATNITSRGKNKISKRIAAPLTTVGKKMAKQTDLSFNTSNNSEKGKDKNPSLKMRIVNVESLHSEVEIQGLKEKVQTVSVSNHIHVCDGCDLRFKTKVAFNLHQHKVHGESNKTMCTACGRQMDLQHELDIHKTFVCRKIKRKYECKVCNIMFTTSRGKAKHPCTKDPNKPLYCLRENCTFKTRIITTLSEHLSRHLGIKQYLCGTCGNSFAAKKDLDRHMDIHKASKDCVCQECGRSYRSANALQTHIRTHKNKDRYKCEYCPYTSPALSGYKQHKLKHKKPAHKCFTCGKCLRTAYSLNKHIRNRHTLDRIFTCKYCDFTTNKGLSYASHMRKHKDMKVNSNSDEESVIEDQLITDAGAIPGFASPSRYFSISNKQPSGTPTQPQRVSGNILSVSTDSPHRTILGDPSLHYDGEVNITGQNADTLMANIVSSVEGHEISMISSETAGTGLTLYSSESISNCPSSIALPSLILSESMTAISTEENWNSGEQGTGNLNG